MIADYDRNGPYGFVVERPSSTTPWILNGVYLTPSQAWRAYDAMTDSEKPHYTVRRVVSQFADTDHAGKLACQRPVE